MKIKALITALILGSSSIAMAQPAFRVEAGMKVNAGRTVVVRDHRTTTPVRAGEWQRRYIESPRTYPVTEYSYGTQSNNEYETGGWALIDGRMSSNWRDQSTVFDVNTWVGSIRLRNDGGPFDAQILYADGRNVSLTNMQTFYQANLAPGVVSRIIIRSSTRGCSPQLMISAANH